MLTEVGGSLPCWDSVPAELLPSARLTLLLLSDAFGCQLVQRQPRPTFVPWGIRAEQRQGRDVGV
jgi:hypothetical protein